MNVTLCDCGDHAFAPTSTQAGVILVSPKDAGLLDRTWSAQKRRWTYYAIRVVQKGKAPLRLHQVVFGPGADHRNRNGLDNRRSNLREASCAQNTQNQIRASRAASKYRGVYPKRDKWEAKLAGLYIGCYGSEEAAARAYDAQAIKRFGADAYTNFRAGDNRDREISASA